MKFPSTHIKLPQTNQLSNISLDYVGQKPSQSQSDSNQSQSQPNHQQIQQTLKTLKKLKKIGKTNQLTILKQKNQKINKIFKKMFQFFSCKNSKKQKQGIQQAKRKQARQKALNLAGIHKKTLYSPLSINSQPQQDQISQVSQIVKNSDIQMKKFKCYICKNHFDQIHYFYHKLCPSCSDFNFQKRTMKANLTGLTAIVTGARIKIGFQIALKLLRDGATVIATTRFFKDAYLRYQKQHDFSAFVNRLHIVQCDFTSSFQVQKMIDLIKSKFLKIDILINNAAQTIVRPKQFYLQQINIQAQQIANLPSHIAQLQDKKHKSQNSLQQLYPSLFLPQKSSLNMIQNSQLTLATTFNSQKAGIYHNIRDQFDQPIDKRQKNSWVQKLQQISLIDCYTTQLVNSIVPFHLISQLKPLMKKKTQQVPSFIINVSSMQGVFYRNNKKSSHPHTNMAKAALNMITRTSAQQFILDNIYMNSVDTGWVTQQNPYSFKQKYPEQRVPLDCIDGAMRCIDPIYQSLNFNKNVYGKFLKDYKQSNY